MSVEAEGASGVDGAGNVKVNVWTVDAGCSVDAMISTSRGKDSCAYSPSAAKHGHAEMKSAP